MRFQCLAVGLALVLALFLSALQPAKAEAKPWRPNPVNPADPLSTDDRNLLVNLHQTALVESAISDQAQQRGSNPQVKDLGSRLAKDKRSLDGQVQSVAMQLGIALPNQPAPQQQGFPAELARKSGPDFDHTYVNRTHAADAQLLSDVAVVRANTRDGTNRSFTEQVGLVLLQHLRLLESSGVVDDSGFPGPTTTSAPTTRTTSAITPSGPASTAPSSLVEAPLTKPTPPPVPAGLAQTDDGSNVGLVALVCVTGAAATVVLLRILRSRKRLDAPTNPGPIPRSPAHRREVVPNNQKTKSVRTE